MTCLHSFFTWIFSRWAVREQIRQQAERQRFDRIMRSNEPPYTAMQSRRQNIRASGFDKDRKRVS